MPDLADAGRAMRAGRRARQALNLSAEAKLDRSEASVLFKYWLLEGLAAGEASAWRRRWRRRKAAGIALRRRLQGLLDTLPQARMHLQEVLAVAADLEWAETSPLYRHRLVDSAIEAILSESISLETCLTPAAERFETLPIKGSRNHAAIFATPCFFTHELYPLVVDAFVRDSQRHGRVRTNVLGARADWLSAAGQLRRMIYLDFERLRFYETDLHPAVAVDSVQFICLGQDELALHRRLSGYLQCAQANPSAPAELADDKAATLAAWSALQLEVPAFQKIAPEDRNGARCFAALFRDIAVKPNSATEGENVAFFQTVNELHGVAFERHLERCWRQGCAIVQERRDGLAYLDPLTGSKHTLALRLNLAFDGRRFCLESGYAQLGADADSPASAGRGGRIVPLDEVLPHLTARNDQTMPQPADMTPLLWSHIGEQAECAAALFEGLLLIGLDVLLDLDPAGHIVPVFLEANPRPAGLIHSRLLNGYPSSTGEMGVSLGMWDGLERLQAEQL